MESGYVSREVSPSRLDQSTVSDPVTGTGTASNLSPGSSSRTRTPVISKPSDIVTINFHHNKIDHKEAESKLKATNSEGSYLTRECKDKRGVFILSYMVSSSNVKHVVIPHKNKHRHLLKIQDLSTEVFSVIKSLKECLVPLVADDNDGDVKEVGNIDVDLDPIPVDNRESTVEEAEMKTKKKSFQLNPLWVEKKRLTKARC